jgi:hypothetical protein
MNIRDIETTRTLPIVPEELKDTVDPRNYVRHWRVMLLDASDWTQIPDNSLSVEKRQEWATWRQAVREYPDVWVEGPTMVFSEKPEL